MRYETLLHTVYSLEDNTDYKIVIHWDCFCQKKVFNSQTAIQNVCIDLIDFRTPEYYIEIKSIVACLQNSIDSKIVYILF